MTHHVQLSIFPPSSLLTTSDLNRQRAEGSLSVGNAVLSLKFCLDPVSTGPLLLSLPSPHFRVDTQPHRERREEDLIHIAVPTALPQGTQDEF